MDDDGGSVDSWSDGFDSDSNEARRLQDGERFHEVFLPPAPPAGGQEVRAVHE